MSICLLRPRAESRSFAVYFRRFWTRPFSSETILFQSGHGHSCFDAGKLEDWPSGNAAVAAVSPRAASSNDGKESGNLRSYIVAVCFCMYVATARTYIPCVGNRKYIHDHLQTHMCTQKHKNTQNRCASVIACVEKNWSEPEQKVSGQEVVVSGDETFSALNQRVRKSIRSCGWDYFPKGKHLLQQSKGFSGSSSRWTDCRVWRHV